MKISIAVLFCLILCGCVTVNPKAREAYIASRPYLSDQEKSDIRAGIIRIGMTKEDVEASLGIKEHAGYYIENKGATTLGAYECWRTVHYRLFFDGDKLTSFSEHS